MKNKIFIAFLFSGYLFFSGIAQSQCDWKNTAFRSGEVLDYEVYYNWGLIWISAGEARFMVKDTIYKGLKAYHFDARGSSLKQWDWFYKVRDRYQAVMDSATLKPLWFKRNTSEGGYEVNNTYIFDPWQRKIFLYLQSSKRPYMEDTLDMPTCTFDVQSMVYYSRNLRFSGIKMNEKISIRMITENKTHDLYIRYLGKETIETRDKKRYQCIKFSVLLVEGSMFTGGENMTIWVTDDPNRLPVLIESKVIVGSVKIYLTQAKGIRSELSSLIRE